MDQPMRVNIDDVDVEFGSFYRYEGKPFTGEIVETVDDRVVELMTVYDGRLQGPARAWYPNGQLRYEGQHRDGRAVGIAREWHPNGQPAMQRVFDERGNLVSDQRWDDNAMPRHPEPGQA